MANYRIYTDGREWGVDITRDEAMAIAKNWRAMWPKCRIYARKVRS